ncbi:MAG: hypothetical protein OEZ06_05975 [Myxococcales bacterium]|nr:hypothetical protein [Myxococcales bacterium]
MSHLGKVPLRQAFVVVAIVLLAAPLLQKTRLAGQNHFGRAQRYEDIYYLPPPDWLDVLSLGHREALADLLWLRALIYFGDEVVNRGGLHNLHNYADAILELDPFFRRVYTWVSAASLYRPLANTAADARQAIAYLERSTRYFPDDGELAWELGASYVYELVPLLDDPAEIREARRKGQEHLELAALRGAGPPWLALSNSTQLGRLGMRQRQIDHLQEIYGQISDPQLKKQVEAALASLVSRQHAETMRRAHDELELERKANFPFLSLALYLLVGKRFDPQSLAIHAFDPAAERTQQDLALPP